MDRAETEFQIEDLVEFHDDEEKATIVEILTESDEAVFRLDIDGKDASRSEGDEGIDWEYVYVKFNLLRKVG